MASKEELQERRERWAQALESGQYAQTKGMLRNRDGYCCLGVACDLYAKETGDEWAPNHDSDGSYSFLSMPTTLPMKVQEWLGLDTPNGDWWEGSTCHALSDDNDAGKSFKEIAAVIRAEPEGLLSR